MENMPKTGEEIALFRVKYHLSLKEFAEKCGVSAQTVSLWEDKDALTPLILRKVARAIPHFASRSVSAPTDTAPPLLGRELLELQARYGLTRIQMAILAGLSPATVNLYARYDLAPISRTASQKIRAAIPAFEIASRNAAPHASTAWRMRLAADPLSGFDLTWIGFLRLKIGTLLYIWHTARADFLPDRWYLCRKNTHKSFVPDAILANETLPAEVRVDSFPLV